MGLLYITKNFVHNARGVEDIGNRVAGEALPMGGVVAWLRYSDAIGTRF